MIVERLVFQDRPFEVPIEKNVFIEVEKIVEKVVDKLVEVPKVEQIFEIREVIQEKIIEVVK